MAEIPSLAELLDGPGERLSERQWRLFACACVRRMEGVARGNSGAAIEIAERFADGQATAHQLTAARYAGRFLPGHAAWAVCWDPNDNSREKVDRALAWATGLLATGSHFFAFRREEEAQARLFLEIATHLMEPVRIDPLWLAWNDRTIPNLAATIYQERAWDQMPILGDALEDAGCGDAGLLEHCRGGGEHVSGCWVLDLLLGKE